MKYSIHLGIIFIIYFSININSQNIIRENGLVPVLPSSDKVLTFEMSSIPGTSYFFSTGDDNTRLWDFKSHKMLAKLTNPGVKSTSINFTTFFHPRFNLFIQQAINSISIYSYPNLEVIKTIELNSFEECLFHPTWDFFIRANEQGVERISLSDFTILDKFKFPEGYPTLGFTHDSLSVTYFHEGKALGIAPINQPSAVQWIDVADFKNMDLKEVISSDLFILEEKLLQSGSSKFEFGSSYQKTYFFYSVKRKAFKVISKLKSDPENLTYWVNGGKVFFNDASYDNGNACFVYSSDSLTLLDELVLKFGTADQDSSKTDSKMKRSNRVQVEQMIMDEADGLIWVLFNNGLASYDLLTLEQKTFLKGVYICMTRVGKGIALIDNDNNMFVIEDYRKSLKPIQIKTDFLDVIYKVERINDLQLNVLSQSGVIRFDLSELSIAHNTPLSKNVSLNNLDHFSFWKGRYFSERYGEQAYYVGEDSVYRKKMKLLYFDNCEKNIYYSIENSICRVRSDKVIYDAETVIDCEYLQTVQDTVESKGELLIDSDMDLDYGFFTFDILQYNPKSEFFYILSLNNSKPRRSDSRNNSMSDRNIDFVKVNSMTKERFEYKIPKNCDELVSLQNGYFLVKHNSDSFREENRFLRNLKSIFLHDLIVFDNGNCLKVLYKLPIGSELVGDSQGRIEDLPFVIISDKKKVLLLNLKTLKENVLYEYPNGEPSDIFENYDFDKELNVLVMYSFRGRNLEYDLNRMKETSRFKAHAWQQHSVGHFDSSTIYSANNEEVKFWKNGKCVFQLYFHKNEGFYIRDTSDVYYATKRIIKDMYFLDKRLNPVGFEQLDPYCNRPSRIQESIGSYLNISLPSSYEVFRNAEVKRINKLRVDSIFKNGQQVTFPEVRIVLPPDLTYEYRMNNLPVTVTLSDSLYSINQFNILVNEVPILGSVGLKIPKDSAHHFTLNYIVPLNVGQNKIQFSVRNELGLENFKYPTYVNYTPEETVSSKTYYVGIGVNHFKDASHDLKYCVKDVQDLAQAFAKNQSKVDTLVFTDSEVTKENILALKGYLQKHTTVNDKVIISCSSHGLLDDSLNFYLATHDVDFSNPKVRGLKYEELESLLDGIPARQKLLLLDACNSGENDKTEQLKLELKQKKEQLDSIQYIAARGVIIDMEEENQINFRKMNELFVNVLNNTGSVIIAASGGMQSAQEGKIVNGKKIENGAFTYSVLEYLAKEFTDQDRCTVNGMKNYVERRVEEITNGEQKPTSRQETMEVDWEIAGNSADRK